MCLTGAHVLVTSARIQQGQSSPGDQGGVKDVGAAVSAGKRKEGL